VQAVHGRRHIGVAQDEGDVPPRRRLRHQPQRHPIERRDGAAEQRRIQSQVLTDDADDCHVRLDVHLGEIA
jgi:hypothetical protein